MSGSSGAAVGGAAGDGAAGGGARQGGSSEYAKDRPQLLFRNRKRWEDKYINDDCGGLDRHLCHQREEALNQGGLQDEQMELARQEATRMLKRHDKGFVPPVFNDEAAQWDSYPHPDDPLFRVSPMVVAGHGQLVREAFSEQIQKRIVSPRMKLRGDKLSMKAATARLIRLATQGYSHLDSQSLPDAGHIAEILRGLGARNDRQHASPMSNEYRPLLPLQGGPQSIVAQGSELYEHMTGMDSRDQIKRLIRVAADLLVLMVCTIHQGGMSFTMGEGNPATAHKELLRNIMAEYFPAIFALMDDLGPGFYNQHVLFNKHVVAYVRSNPKKHNPYHASFLEASDYWERNCRGKMQTGMIWDFGSYLMLKVMETTMLDPETRKIYQKGTDKFIEQHPHGDLFYTHIVDQLLEKTKGAAAAYGGGPPASGGGAPPASGGGGSAGGDGGEGSGRNVRARTGNDPGYNQGKGTGGNGDPVTGID